jgi:hypothetical protein
VPAQYAAAAELERYRVQIASATEPIDRKTASGRLTFGMLAVMADAQSDQLAEKMRDTRLAEARQGRLVEPVPVGYERRNGQLVPTPQAEALRLAFQMLCTGDYGATKITRAINAAGYRMPDGSPFKVTAVQEMLTKPVYAGFVTCAEQVFPGKHEPIIDLTTWERAQEIVKVRSWRRPRPDAPNEPLLAGLAMCPYCGAPMWHNTRGMSKAAYERKRDDLMARSAAPPARRVVGVEAILPLLRDLPALLIAATNSERRAVVRELVTQVYVQRSVVMAIRPTKIATALFEAAATDHQDEWLKFVRWWAGWGSNPRHSA